MISAKKVIKALKGIFTIAWYVNVILAGSALVFQIINLILKKKMVLASFLGDFKVDSKSAGVLHVFEEHLNIHIDNFTLNPTMLIESPMSQWMILIYSVFVLSIVLFYNYQFKALFVELNQSIVDKEMFKVQSIKRFQLMSLFSLAVFVVGSVSSLVKVLFVKNIMVGSLNLIPVFDNRIFNLLWLSVALYLIALIFKVGLSLKEENDLTI